MGDEEIYSVEMILACSGRFDKVRNFSGEAASRKAGLTVRRRGPKRRALDWKEGGGSAAPTKPECTSTN